MHTSPQEKQFLRNNIIELIHCNPKLVNCIELLIQLQQDMQISNALWPSSDYIRNIDDTINTHYSLHSLAAQWSASSPLFETLTHYQQFCILYYLLDMKPEELHVLKEDIQKFTKKTIKI